MDLVCRRVVHLSFLVADGVKQSQAGGVFFVSFDFFKDREEQFSRTLED